MDSVELSAEATVAGILRELEEHHGPDKGRMILTILYLVVLGLCCITPVIYYCRLYLEERRTLRAQTTLAEIQLQQSAAQRMEQRAAQRKFILERRARILQLFASVRAVSI